MKKKVIISSVVVLVIIGLIVCGFLLLKDKDEVKGNIELNIKVLDNLKISADGINYGEELNKDSLMVSDSNYKSRNQLPNVLGRMSTSGRINDGKLDLFYVTIKSKDKEYFLSSTKQKDEKCYNEECKENYYIVYDLFFKTDIPESIVLTNNSYIKQKDDNGLENAMRVGFLVEGTTNSDDINDIHDLGAGNKIIIWEPNSDSHTGEAINFAKDIYNEELEGRELYYRGVNKNFEEIKLNEMNTNSAFSNISTNIVTGKDFEGQQEVFTIQQGVTKVRVYIWLENGDKDAMFEKAVTNLDINLEFKIAK